MSPRPTASQRHGNRKTRRRSGPCAQRSGRRRSRAAVRARVPRAASPSRRQRRISCAGAAVRSAAGPEASASAPACCRRAGRRWAPGADRSAAARAASLRDSGAASPSVQSRSWCGMWNRDQLRGHPVVLATMVLLHCLRRPTLLLLLSLWPRAQPPTLPCPKVCPCPEVTLGLPRRRAMTRLPLLLLRSPASSDRRCRLPKPD
mmetsp:Transcript_90671/g.259330  ORF Transcript_90671/g.259330 Transcript_90671/m.259330 type:complete len:204 (-) Transcript_90671:550-1161(-)